MHFPGFCVSNRETCSTHLISRVADGDRWRAQKPSLAQPSSWHEVKGAARPPSTLQVVASHPGHILPRLCPHATSAGDSTSPPTNPLVLVPDQRFFVWSGRSSFLFLVSSARPTFFSFFQRLTSIGPKSFVILSTAGCRLSSSSFSRLAQLQTSISILAPLLRAEQVSHPSPCCTGHEPPFPSFRIWVVLP